MTFLEMARLTLEKACVPLTVDEIWNKGLEYGYAQQVMTTGKTPSRTIGAQLYVNIRDNSKSDFCIISKRPTRFAFFSKQINQTPIGVFSFGLKRKIEFSNLRESYFQAVSNSRWANKGYLVCAEIDQNDIELLDELGRLANAYGIGVIKLDIVNPDESRVLYEAHYNESIEWGFVNYLFELNADYKMFIEASIDIMKTEALYREKFDKVLSQQEILTCVKGFKD